MNEDWEKLPQNEKDLYNPNISYKMLIITDGEARRKREIITEDKKVYAPYKRGHKKI